MTPSTPAAPRSLILHTLRCIGFADTPRVAEAAGTDLQETESELIDLAVAGLVTREPGPFGGWGPTAAGKEADARRTALELSTTGARPAVDQAYGRFLALNPELLDLCAAWQLRPAAGALSGPDQLEEAWDARVLDLLSDLDARAQPVCRDLAAALPRFDRYRIRLTGALTRARAGDTRYVTESTDSYHSVWFQWHEDLLATLGIPR